MCYSGGSSAVMNEVSTSEGSVSISGLEYGFLLLIRAPNILRNLAVASRVIVSCSLDTGVREALHSSVYSGTGVGCIL